jgi:tRNA A-37 threonylcarbamoyl transferase component Bud32
MTSTSRKGVTAAGGDVGPAADVAVVEADASGGVRSPVDVLRLITAATLTAGVLLADRLFGGALVEFIDELFAGLSALPSWFVDVVVAGSRLLSPLLLVAGVVSVVRDGRWRPVPPVVTAALAAAAVAGLLGFDTGGGGAVAVDAPLGPLADGDFPTTAGVAAAAAAVTAAAPWLARRWRQAGWVAVLGLAVTRFLASPASLDTLAAVVVGWLAGAAAVVVFGGPWRRPRGRAVAAGLARVGVPITRLEQASLDARGSTPYLAVTAAGTHLFVKTLGDDERSADQLFRLYRRLVPRDLGDERPFSSLRRAVEHEALVAVSARQVGVRTPRFVALARAEPSGYVLAYEAVDGRSLDRVPPDEVTDTRLGAVWSQVADLRGHRIAHRDLRLANIFLGDGGDLWLIDFGFSELAASDTLLATDVAELVASSSTQVGAERAVARAVDAIGPDAVRSALPRLRPWALSGATRASLKQQDGMLDDVRGRIEDL